MSNPNPFLIPELISNDPFLAIFEQKKDTIFFEYMSYRNYLNFLIVIGTRLKDNLPKYGQLASRVSQAMENQNKAELEILIPSQDLITNEIQLDHESFVVFSKIFLDKLGILIEKLSNIKSTNYTHSFTEHKKLFIKNSKMNPSYSRLLASIHWYDQFLDIMRNKIIEHGGALSTMIKAGKNGIEYKRKRGTFGIPSDKDQIVIRNLIVKYGKVDAGIANIPPNRYTMLDELMMMTLDRNIKLDKTDLDDLGIAVKNCGGFIDAVILAKHLRKFLQDAAALFV